MLIKFALTVLVMVMATLLPRDVVAVTPRRVEVHLYGGDTTRDAPLAPWYRSLGITDVWLAYGKGAFPQDTANDGYLPSALTAEDMEAAGILASYRNHHIRYWWFERPVPDFLYVISKRPNNPNSHLWDSTAQTDAVWDGICRKIKTRYPAVREAGFAGVVYDSEAYYSYQGDEAGKEKPWLWGGHDDQYGLEGNYYKRGMQIGKAINSVWPKGKLIIVYAHGHEGEKWFYHGIQDGGVDFHLGPEHTYGAGPVEKALGNAWYQSWWRGENTKNTCDWKRTQFPFIADNQHLIAGLFPINFGTQRPNYRARYFREQLHSAAMDDAKGPIAVWLWPEGPFTPQSWGKIRYASGESADDYLQALRDYSQVFSEDENAPR